MTLRVRVADAAASFIVQLRSKVRCRGTGKGHGRRTGEGRFGSPHEAAALATRTLGCVSGHLELACFSSRSHLELACFSSRIRLRKSPQAPGSAGLVGFEFSEGSCCCCVVRLLLFGATQPGGRALPFLALDHACGGRRI